MSTIAQIPFSETRVRQLLRLAPLTSRDAEVADGDRQSQRRSDSFPTKGNPRSFVNAVSERGLTLGQKNYKLTPINYDY